MYCLCRLDYLGDALAITAHQDTRGLRPCAPTFPRLCLVSVSMAFRPFQPFAQATRIPPPGQTPINL